MPYKTKEFFIFKHQKAIWFLVHELGLSMKEAQSFIDKKRLYCNGELVVKKSQIVQGKIHYICYVPEPKGLEPVYENDDFAVFDKPSGVLVHPKNRNDLYSLNDDIKYLYGKDANVAHRLDKETSGLVVVAKNKQSEVDIKRLFEAQEVKKKYNALVFGKIMQDMSIDKPLKCNNDYSLIKIKVFVDDGGKSSKTIVKPIKYFEDINATWIELIPITGRQHQLRAHMFHVEHSIVGDPLYGVSPEEGASYLDGEMSEEKRLLLTKSTRLLLHASCVSFEYKNIFFEFCSDKLSSSDAYNMYFKG